MDLGSFLFCDRVGGGVTHELFPVFLDISDGDTVIDDCS